ncbi:MAG TPA: hypothetical protein VGX03_14285 [Candidatus Binatia bacterium]|jgi:hypothetical protein|nr:hypothetical protein [Candidatus Binatia bacterium]
MRYVIAMRKLTTLLPSARGLRFHSLSIDRHAKRIQVFLFTEAPRAPCPLCGNLTVRAHSRYRRTLACSRH